MRLQRDLDILLHRQPGKQRKRLKHNRGVGIHALHWLATIQLLSLRRRLQPGDNAQERTLATPRRPEERDEFAFVHTQVDVLQGNETVCPSTVHLAHMPQFDQTRRRIHGLLQPVTLFRQAVQASPHQAINRRDGQDHSQGGSQEQGILPRCGRLRNESADPRD